MEGLGDTASLRSQASRWSLAGDKHLLDLLQTLHERIMTKCQETNTMLERMVSALDDASVDLQNVNNKFMALSNSQFIESRVYDDNDDIATETTTPKEQQKSGMSTSPQTDIKQSLHILESFHESVHILCDESGTDSEDDDIISRIILKPKDVYAERPLPYIIGSQSWRSKWHVGLVCEDSDTDSTASKHELPLEEYSDSESEPQIHTDTHPDPRDISPAPASAPAPAPAPATVAAQLARRLAAAPPAPAPAPAPASQAISEPDYSPPNPGTGKIYRPEQPTAGVVFSDEPPPIDAYSDTYSSDDDIFAELNKKKPFANNRVNEDLFAFNNEPYEDDNKEEDSENTFRDAADKANKPKVKQESTLFSDESEPELFVEKPVAKPNLTKIESNDNNSKKPASGVSLFGSKQGAESISAAILKHNEQKLLRSGKERKEINEKPITNKVEKEPIRKEKDIFHDLFAKSEKAPHKEKNEDKKIENNSSIDKKVDIFNDNLFDDIDDIFTSNIVTKVPVKEPNDKVKSLFDDEDELFADIGVESVKDSKKRVKPKSLFDSDDELFSENIIKNEGKNNVDIDNSENSNEFLDNTENVFSKSGESSSGITKSNHHAFSDTKIKPYKEPKGMFSDSSDDDIFAKNKYKPLPEKSMDIPCLKEPNKEKGNEPPNIENLENNTSLKNIVDTTKMESNKMFTSYPSELVPSIPEMKTDISKPQNNTSQTVEVREDEIDDMFKKSLSEKRKESGFNSPSLFGDDDDNDENIFAKVTEKGFINRTDIFVHAKNTDKEIPDPVENTSDTSNICSRKIKETEDSLISKVSVENNDKTTELLANENIASNDFDEVPLEFNTSNNEERPSLQFFEDPKLTKVQKPTTTNVKVNYIDTIVPESPSTIEALDNNFDDFTINTDNTSVSTLQELNLSKNDIFSEIFNDVPPVFEKPKEPKKSKNINALFDDDSDDEALFFKKNDHLDDKPEDDDFTIKTSEDKLFGIFHDEPPAVDIDFATKPSEITENSQNIINNIQLHKDLVSKTDLVFDEESPKLAENAEIKKVGKLKNINFNINVSTLLPGASPKKAPKVLEEIDGKISSKSSEELYTGVPGDLQSKIVKSVSFEGDPDKAVLDNKLSKERAKIQVKRRPSTRRARKEAVRKSGIDFGDDSTDNSNSIDDLPKSSLSTNSVKDEIEDIPRDTNTGVKSKIVYVLNDEDIFNTKSENVENKNAVSNTVDNFKGGITTLGITYGNPENSEISKTKINKINSENTDDTVIKDDKKSKSLFDLSDEETQLFTNKKQKVKNNIFDSDSEDDLFGRKKETKDTDIVKNRESNEIKTSIAKKSLFDDDDGDDLFGNQPKKLPDVKPQTSKPKDASKSTGPVFEDPLSMFGDEDD